MSEADPEARPVVLLVDDNDDILQGYAELLRHADFEPLIARSGGEALEMARKIHPTVIVMDLWMPHMDGFETARALKEDLRTKDISILAFTSLGYSQRKAEDAGCDASLKKTAGADQFLMTIRKLAARRNLEPSS
jgi:CheY-like chemotaxis protein